MPCNSCDDLKVWKNGEKYFWKSQNRFSECVAKFCREGRNAGKPGPCPKDNSPDSVKATRKTTKLSPEEKQSKKDYESLNKAVKEYSGQIDQLEKSKSGPRKNFTDAVTKLKDLTYKAERSSSGMTPSVKAAIAAAKSDQAKADAELNSIQSNIDKVNHRLSVVKDNRRVMEEKFQKKQKTKSS